MSSVVDPNPESSEHEELVAYLDGELAPEDCRKVEERLANDAEYRQHLRDLDQAWEALGALPSTAVDDGFARTTIELACVAAEEDLSQRTSLTAVENRGRRRWWIAGAVTAAVVGFLMVRALAVHRNNMLLADLPVITEINALGMVHDIDFLRQLSKAGFDKDVTKDEAFHRELNDFTKANSVSFDERREWANALTPEKKADLADRTREFAELRQKPEETERLRQLAKDIRDAEDGAALRSTLVAYGQWLSRQGAGELYQLRLDFENTPPRQQVDAVLKLAQREKEQVAKTLSPENKTALRNEIFALAKQKRAEYVANPPAGKASLIANADPKNEKVALFIFLREALQNDEDILQRLEELTPDARDHLNKISRWQPDRRRWQMWGWIHEATQPKPKAEELERFFATSNAITPDVRQKLLDMPKDKMEVALERLYWKTELGIDEPLMPMREFGDRARGPRNGPRGQGPPEGGRRGPGPQRGPDGPPPDRPFPPPDEFERDPLGLGPGGRPRPEDGPERGRRRPPDGKGPRDGRQGPPPPPGEDGPPN